MAWKGRLAAVPETSDPTDSFFIEVEFYDGATGRSFTRSLKLTAGNVTNLQDVKDIVAAKVAELTKLDQAKAFLTNRIGQDL